MGTMDAFFLKPTPQTNRLKPLLEAAGYRFPCSGQGICGKCRVTCSALPITTLDERFLNPTELAQGVRLACDKTLTGEVTLTNIAMAQAANEPSKLEEPKVSAVLFADTLTLSIFDDHFTKTEVFSLSSPQTTLSLRADIGKNTVEFLEHFSAPKATSLFLSGSQQQIRTFFGKQDTTPNWLEGAYWDAALFDMPAEFVFVAPVKENLVSGTLTLALLDSEPHTLHYFLDEGVLVYLGSEHHLAAPFPRDFLPLALTYFANQHPSLPPPTLVEHQKTDEVFTKNAQRTLFANRVKTKLNRITRQLEVFDLLANDAFQNLIPQ